jgi:hypothetical protein
MGRDSFTFYLSEVKFELLSFSVFNRFVFTVKERTDERRRLAQSTLISSYLSSALGIKLLPTQNFYTPFVSVFRDIPASIYPFGL